MLVIGLTGPSGSGKGVVGRFFEERGIPVLDTDAVYHALIDRPSACTQELKENFGDTILTADGGVDRKKLAALVFGESNGQKERLLLLNRITHRYVLDTCRHWLKAKKEEGKRGAVIDAPLLYESGFDKECDRVIAVLASRESRLARIMLRDGLTVTDAERRLASQPMDDFYTDKADFIIQNDGTPQAAKQAVINILRQLSVE